MVGVLWVHIAFLGMALRHEPLHEYGFFWANAHADVVDVYGLNGDIRRG